MRRIVDDYNIAYFHIIIRIKYHISYSVFENWNGCSKSLIGFQTLHWLSQHCMLLFKVTQCNNISNMSSIGCSYIIEHNWLACWNITFSLNSYSIV